MKAVREAVSADLATVAEHWRNMPNVAAEEFAGQATTDGAFNTRRWRINQGARDARHSAAFSHVRRTSFLSLRFKLSARDASVVFRAQLSTSMILA